LEEITLSTYIVIISFKIFPLQKVFITERDQSNSHHLLTATEL
jgi:hypothetical protein